MPDETNPVPPKSGRINVKQASVGQANVSNATFTRADIQTGEVKSLEGDILSEIRNAVTEQTDTLSKSFKKSIDDCCKELLKGGGAGGGMGGSDDVQDALKDISNAVKALGPQISMGGGEGGGDPGTIAQTRRTQALSGAIEDLGITVDDAGNKSIKLFNTFEELEIQIRENLNETIREMNATIIKALGSFTRWSSFSDELFSRWNKGLELASSGMADFNTLIGDDTLKLFQFGLGEARDSLIKTAEQIRTMADEITSPMRLVQGNVADVAREFNRLRDEAEDFGLDLYDRVGFEEQNKLLTTLIDEQRRGSIQADFRNFDTRRLAMEQLDFMGMVADNTGKSLDAILQQHKETAKTFEELQGLGIINEQQAASFKMMSDAFPQHTEFFQKIAASGGDMSVFARKFPDLFQDLQAMGATDIISEIGNLSKSGVTGNELANQVMSSMQSGLGDASERFGSAAASIMFEGRDIQNLIGNTNQMAKFQKNIGEKSGFVRAWNRFSDVFTNTWPIQWAKSIGALGFNTIAILANTRVHAKGSGIIGGALSGFKNVFGKLGGLLRGGGAAAASMGGYAAMPGAITSGAAGASSMLAGGGTAAASGAAGAGIMGKMGGALAGIGKLAGGVGAAALVGKDVYDLATGDTSGENIGALLGSVVGGAIGLVGGPMGVAAGASIGNMAGQWIGGKLAGGSPATPTTPSYKPRGSAGASRPGGGQQAFAMHMARQTELLGSLNTKMERSIAVQGDIASGINKIGVNNQMAVGAARAGGAGGAQLFAESPSMQTKTG